MNPSFKDQLLSSYAPDVYKDMKSHHYQKPKPRYRLARFDERGCLPHAFMESKRFFPAEIDGQKIGYWIQ